MENKENKNVADVQKAKDKKESEQIRLEIKRVKGLKKERKEADKQLLRDFISKKEEEFFKEFTILENKINQHQDKEKSIKEKVVALKEKNVSLNNEASLLEKENAKEENPKTLQINKDKLLLIPAKITALAKEIEISLKDREQFTAEKQQMLKELNEKKLELKEEINNIKKAWKEKYRKGDWSDEQDDNIIKVVDVEKFYITPGIVTPVLKKLSVNIKKGSITAILGPSGSGKTTLLNLISGLDTTQAGDLIVNDRNLIYLSDSDLTKFRAANVSFVFQSYNLLPTLNVIENVKTGSQLQKDKKKKLDEEMLLKKLGLYEERFKYPYQLSGGQQQRVSIARALSKNPAILFGDEPTGALDTETSVQVLETLIKVNKDFGTTLVLVTHNPSIAKICNQVIKVKNGVVDKVVYNPTPLKPSQIKWD